MKLLIGICGRARHGKDSTALAIKQRLEAQGVSCFHSSVSAMVFEEAVRLGTVTAFSRDACTRPDLYELVRLGHERRAMRADVWIERLVARIADSHAIVAIVPGIRFDNEVSWVRREGVLLRVTRYNTDGSLFISPDRDPNDPMETVLNRVNADHEITVKTGQENWLHWQGVSFANFVYETYLRGEKHVPHPLDRIVAVASVIGGGPVQPADTFNTVGGADRDAVVHDASAGV